MTNNAVLIKSFLEMEVEQIKLHLHYYVQQVLEEYREYIKRCQSLLV
jgi:hypothetical protein